MILFNYFEGGLNMENNNEVMINGLSFRLDALRDWIAVIPYEKLTVQEFNQISETLDKALLQIYKYTNINK